MRPPALVGCMARTHGLHGYGYPQRGVGGVAVAMPGHNPAPLPPLSQGEDTSKPANGSLTTHVLNTAMGLPATGIAIQVAQLQEPGTQWMELAQR